MGDEIMAERDTNNCIELQNGLPFENHGSNKVSSNDEVNGNIFAIKTIASQIQKLAEVNTIRPEMCEFDEVVRCLKVKYGSKKASSIAEVVNNNPEYGNTIRKMSGQSQKLFGMSLAPYFMQEGIIEKRQKMNFNSSPIIPKVEHKKNVTLLPVWKVRFTKEILERGEKYYSNGSVKEVLQNGDVFEATVTGTKKYHVRLTIKNGKLIASQCDCPNAEEGYLCKHMAAVLFAVENGNVIQQETAKDEGKANLATKYKDYSSQKQSDVSFERKPVTRKEYIDPNFNTSILDKKVKYWQQQLLDHGKRNKMMHFKETTKTTLNLTSPGFDDLYTRLVVNNESLSFRRPIGKNDDAKMYSLLQLAKGLDSGIEFAKGDIETKGTYSNCAAACNNLRAKAQLALDEQGTNILYLCFGFIEWRRKITGSGEEDWMKSPLVLVPVKINMNSLISPYEIKRREDDIVVNPTLAHYFEEQYRIKLPALDSNPKLNDVLRFMDDVEEMATSRGWRISKECCVGLMSFLKITMYNDMVKNEESIKKNPIIRAFAGESNSVNRLDDLDLSFNHDVLSSMDSFQVMDADSSQQDAIELSRQGVSFVLQGPPGTGKSQTITNIIAEGLADGKKILFVSEKLAALEVVYKRLKEANLDKFCLPLHNHKANKKDIIDEIGQNLQLQKVRTKSESLVKLAQIDNLKSKLNHYINDIYEPIQPFGSTLYDIYGAIAEQDGVPIVSITIDNILNLTRSDFYQLLMLIKSYDSARMVLGDKWNENPWTKSNINLYSNVQKEELLSNLNAELQSLNLASETQIKAKPFTSFMSLNTLEDYIATKNDLKNCKIIPARWFKGKELYSNLEQEKALLNKLKICFDQNIESKSKLLERFDDDFVNIDGKRMTDALKEAMSALLYEYPSSEQDNIFERKESIRENLKSIIDILVFYNEKLKEFHREYGFDESVSVETFKKYIQVLRITMNGYLFTEYYFGDGMSDVKETAENTKKLMDDLDKKKYLLNKEYLKDVYSNQMIESYIQKLNSARNAVESSCPAGEEQIHFMRRAIESEKITSAERNEILQNREYAELSYKYHLPPNNTLKQLRTRIKAIKSLLDNEENISASSLNLKLVAEQAKKNKNIISNVSEQRRQFVEEAQISQDCFSNLDFFSMLKEEFAEPELYINMMHDNSVQSYLTKYENASKKNDEFRKLFNEKRKELGIKNAISELELIDILSSNSKKIIECHACDAWGYGKDTAKALIEKQLTLQAQILPLYREIVEKYGDAILTIDTSSLLNRFKYEYAGTFKAFNKRYKEDCKLVNDTVSSKYALKDQEIIAILEEADEYKKLYDLYTSSKKNVCMYLGVTDYSIDYDWENVKSNMDCFELIESLLDNPLKASSAINEGLLSKLVETIETVEDKEYLNQLDEEGKLILGQLYNGQHTDVKQIRDRIEKLEQLSELFVNSDSLILFLKRSDKNKKLDEIIDGEKQLQEARNWFANNAEIIESSFGISKPEDYDQYDSIIEKMDIVENARKSFGDGYESVVDTMSKDEMAIAISNWSKMISLAEKLGYKDEDYIEDAIYLRNDNTSIYKSVLDVYEQLNALRFRDIGKQSISEIIGELEAIRDVEKETAKMETLNIRNRTILGDAYEGFDTDWDLIDSMINSAGMILDVFDGKLDRKVKRKLLEHEPFCSEEYLKSIELKKVEFDRASENMAHLADLTIDELKEVCFDGIHAIDFIQYCQEKVNMYSSKSLTFTEMVDALETLGELRESESKLQDIRTQCDNLLPEFNLTEAVGITSAVATIENIKKARETIVERGLNTDCVEWMTSNPENTAKAINTIEILEKDKEKYKKFAELFNDSSVLKSISLSELQQRIDRGIKYFGMVGQTVDLKEYEKKCIENGIGDFIQIAKKNDDFVGHMDKVFTKSFYYAWLNAQIENLDVLRTFSAAEQNENVKQYSKLDTERLDIAKIRINEKLIENMPTKDSGIGKGEVSILLNEMNKKQGQMSIRNLFERIPKLLLQLKPCLMMSPLSVSYFLESQSYKFDMVIFDEASQIFPQDAIGSISRGKQVIIVGDTKQLPPTNFFNAKAITGEDSTEDDEDDDINVISDSILEEANNHLVSRSLLWHYRSKNEGLISFSNREIYNGNLVTFPSSRMNVSDQGVEYVYVSNGRYQDQVNEEEASRCVRLVKEHIVNHPDRSLGIIAFSEKQQTLIEEKIRRWRIRNKQYEYFFSENKADPFFVKNLENVQGDERDTIIFSICYAKDPRGILYYRFGPLGTSGGERRLNVAVTRAKYNIKLVGSLLPEDINLEKVSSEGVKLLRKYIDYAMNGVSVLKEKKTVENGNSDPFIASIANYIQKEGYEVAVNVGDSDYKVNIGVINPHDKNRFIAGIECDGETYRMARTTRDRDDLRPRVLGGMGWNTYHIWSAEWIRNTPAEKQKLMDFIKKAEAKEAR